MTKWPRTFDNASSMSLAEALALARAPTCLAASRSEITWPRPQIRVRVHAPFVAQCGGMFSLNVSSSMVSGSG